MFALYCRDVRLALRSGSASALSVAFLLTVVVTVPLGVGPEPQSLSPIAPAIIWIGVLLASLLSLERIFFQDHEDGILDALIAGPLPPEVIAAAKAGAHWTTTGLPLILAAPVLAWFLHLSAEAWRWLVFSLVVGTPAVSFIGMFNAALTLRIRRGGLLLSILVLPMCIPTLVFGVDVLARAELGQSPVVPLMFLAGLSFLSAATLPFAAGYALRANLE